MPSMQNNRVRTMVAGLLLVALTWIAAPGCRREPFAVVAARGKVVYEDGSPLPGSRIRLTFVPQCAPLDPKTYPRAGIAEVKSDGSFECVTTNRYGDGITAGEHKVFLTVLDSQERVMNVVPEEYLSAEKTPLIIKSSDGPNYTLMIKKPAGR